MAMSQYVSYTLYVNRADKRLTTLISQNNGPIPNRRVSTNLNQLQQLQTKEMITFKLKKKATAQRSHLSLKKKQLHRTNTS
jgi:hypothetical protein